MALSDLFRPKWKHSNASVRARAVASLSDEKILANLATSDDDDDVRVAALAKVHDQQVLGAILENERSPHLRSAAVQNLADQVRIEDLVRNDKDTAVRFAAVGRLLSEAKALEVVRTDSDLAVRQAALAKIQDQAALESIARSSEPEALRIGALDRLRSASVLAAIVREDASVRIAREAAKRIRDKAVLQALAATETRGEVKKVVLVAMLVGREQELRRQYDAGRLDDIVNELSPLVDSLPPELTRLLSSVLSDRGGAHYKRGDHERALEDFRKAAKVNPKNWRAQLNVGQLAIAGGRAGEAMIAFHSALSASEGDVQARSVVTATMTRLGLGSAAAVFRA
jgi:tetratricopeptide (TPR) repeat protein